MRTIYVNRYEPTFGHLRHQANLEVQDIVPTGLTDSAYEPTRWYSCRRRQQRDLGSLTNADARKVHGRSTP